MRRFNDIRAKFDAMKEDSQKREALAIAFISSLKLTGIKVTLINSDITETDCGCGEKRHQRVFPFKRD